VSQSDTAATGSPEDILRRAAAAPHWDGFPPLDDLLRRFDAVAAAHPGLVSRRRVGTSRLGEAIPAYSVAGGRRRHLVVGGVHPNEPIGSWTALHLMSELAEDAALRDGLNASWQIVPCVDPDAYRLNEGWFADPTDRAHYARHFYRPAGDEQVEWTFPFAHKRAYFDRMLPETQALARLIDQTRPDLYVPLHNSEMGGVYYYLTRPAPPLQDLLARLPGHFGLPLHQGEPESGNLETLAPGIYATGDQAQAYDWAEGLGLEPFPPGSGGASSTEYAQRFGTLGLIAELPLWRHRQADDTSPAGETYAGLLARTGRQLAELSDILCGVLAEAQPCLTLDTPFLRGARSFARGIAQSAEASLARARQPDSQRPASVAERFDCEDVVRMFRLRYGGMTCRALAAEVQAGLAPAELRRLAAQMADRFAAWTDEARTLDGAAPIAVERLVGVQYGAILAGAAYCEGLF
jgi:predicted deacylase